MTKVTLINVFTIVLQAINDYFSSGGCGLGHYCSEVVIRSSARANASGVGCLPIQMHWGGIGIV